MTVPPLFDISAGFAKTHEASQGIFRQVLRSMSRPGLIVDINPPVSASLCTKASAAGSILLALMDSDSSLNISKNLQSSAWPKFLKFHTGCILSETYAGSNFIWINDLKNLPSLHECDLGSETFPESCTTLLLDVQAFQVTQSGTDSTSWTGPGISETISVDIAGVGASFWEERRLIRDVYPRGIDVIFCSANQIVSLPRSTRIGGH